MLRGRALLALSAVLAAIAAVPRHGADRAVLAHSLRSDRLSSVVLPLNFAPNQGQFGRQVGFVGQALGSTVLLTDSGIALGSAGLHFLGARPHPRFIGLDPLPGKASFFLGNDRGRWRTDLPTYAAVREVGVYPGVDVDYHAAPDHPSGLEYDWVLRPGARPSSIRQRIEGPVQAQLDRDGNLWLRDGRAASILSRPRVYQMERGGIRDVPGGFVVRGRTVGYRIGPHDPSQGLVIDPSWSYGTYLGGTESDTALGVAVDNRGIIHVAGTTHSADFPTAQPVQSANHGDGDIFVAQLDPSGSKLVSSTYLGGELNDEALGIAVDATGATYITGDSLSDDYPVANALQATNRSKCLSTDKDPVPCADAILTKLSPAGDALIYSTYLGGEGTDEGYAIAVDDAGNAYLTGRTNSEDFPTANAAQPHNASPLCIGDSGKDEPCYDAFIAKVDPSGRQLRYSTYLGGTENDAGNGIAVDDRGDAYVCGDTLSDNFPMANPIERGPSRERDAFVALLTPDGNGLYYSTYLGGSKDDVCLNIAVKDYSAYVTGFTSSPDFPTTAGALQTSGRGLDAFVAKIAPGGGTLEYSTYLGGSGDDSGYDVAVDGNGSAYVVGDTNSSDFPTRDAAQPALGGKSDAFVAQINAAGNGLVQSTYLGGTDDDYGHAVALDGAGNAYLAGFTASTDFPTDHPLQRPAGSFDAYVVKLGDKTLPTPTSTLTPTSTPTITPTATPTLTANGTNSPARKPCRKGYKRVHGKCKKVKKKHRLAPW